MYVSRSRSYCFMYSFVICSFYSLFFSCVSFLFSSFFHFTMIYIHRNKQINKNNKKKTHKTNGRNIGTKKDTCTGTHHHHCGYLEHNNIFFSFYFTFYRFRVANTKFIVFGMETKTI